MLNEAQDNCAAICSNACIVVYLHSSLHIYVHIYVVFADALLNYTVDGTVRLVGGTTPLQGRVEILLLGQWGTVCDNSWDLADATVVCHQLGYPRAVGAPKSAAFGAGSGPSWYSYIDCIGVERNLTECSNNGLSSYACSHYQDAGVMCSSECYTIATEL